MDLSIAEGIAILAISAPITVAVIKVIPWNSRRNGPGVSQEVCTAVHRGVDRELAQIQATLVRIEAKIDQVGAGP